MALVKDQTPNMRYVRARSICMPSSLSHEARGITRKEFGKWWNVGEVEMKVEIDGME